MLLAQKREGVTADYLDMGYRGSSWETELVGSEPSEKKSMGVGGRNQ